MSINQASLLTILRSFNQLTCTSVAGLNLYSLCKTLRVIRKIEFKIDVYVFCCFLRF